MAKISGKKLASLSPEEIGSMSKKEVFALLRAVRSLYKSRAKTFEKYRESVWSPAYEQAKSYYDEKGFRSVPSLTRNQALNEIFNVQQFFQAESGTLAGARRIAKEQDVRIFGSTKSGAPKHKMSVEQRSNFWSLYNEFINTFKTSATVFGSNAIQQYLGEIVRGSKSVEVTPDVLQNLMNNLREREFGGVDDGEPFGNVYSGGWFNNQ